MLCPFSFLGYVDMLGVAYEAPTLATGYGAFLAQVSICKQEQCVHSAAEATLVLRD